MERKTPMRTVNLTGNFKRRWQFVKQFFHETQNNDFWLDVHKFARSMTKEFFQITLEEEMIQYQQRIPYQRIKGRLDYRNGHYTRNFDTGFGPIENIKVPRSRSGLFEPSMFKKYQRRQESVNQSIINCFLLGVSTRNVKDVLKPLLGVNISASTVSNATKSVSRLVKQFHSRKLLDEYQFLFLDGINISVRYGNRSIKKTVLAAYGITLFGQRELIDFRIVKSESKDAWESFLNHLFNRGLTGENLKLIITDGGKGLIAALAIVYPEIKHQRCWFHKLQNITKLLKKKDQKEIMKILRKIYNAQSKAHALKIFKTLKKNWSKDYPKVIKSLDRDLEELLNFLTIPIKQNYRAFIRKRIRTTNVIERSFREVRRRTRPMSCFNNNDSLQRIMYAVFYRLNTNWKDKPLVQFTQFI
ncbi:MAG: IS256 family transposase [Candidatus Auribacterota bacterium]|nr:IS256 family transposase [Candidatus Auribacterota bacterium]